MSDSEENSALTRNVFYCWRLFSSMMLSLLIVSCYDTNQNISDRIAEAEENVTQSVPLAKQFCAAYPEHQVNVATLVSEKPYKRDVQIIAFAHGRYILYLDYVVELKSSRDMTVKSFSDPKLYVREVVSVYLSENGNPAVRFGDTFQIEGDELKRLQKEGFQLEEFGLPVKKNDPIPGFYEYSREQLRKDW